MPVLVYNILWIGKKINYYENYYKRIISRQS